MPMKNDNSYSLIKIEITQRKKTICKWESKLLKNRKVECFDYKLQMNKYQIKDLIGSGNFSKVFKVENPESHQIFALKIMKTHQKIALREAKILSKMNHPNVVKLYNFQQNQHQSKLLLEFVGINTLELYEAHSFGLREEQVKCILFQAALGLAYVHSLGVINRDVKPQNILIDKRNALVKIIDFGLAINQKQVSTDYIATRWYRAPENLLCTKQYTCSVDVFALACVIVELYLGGPLFPGSDNLDQIHKIFSILGYPTQQNWPLGYQRATQLGIKMNKNSTAMQLKNILNPCDPLLLDILEKMLQLNPASRIKCQDIVRHPYFKDVKIIIPPFVYQRYQEDYAGKPPTSNTTHTKTSSTDGIGNEPKSKFEKIVFRGAHQLKQPKNIKQSLQLIKINSNKTNFLANHPTPNSFKSLDHFGKTRIKKKASISSVDSQNFNHQFGKVSRTDSLDKKIGHFPSNSIKIRNKTSRNDEFSVQYQVSQLSDPPAIDSPLPENSGNILAASGERLIRNYSEAIKPVTIRINRQNSREINSGKNSESSRKQASRAQNHGDSSLISRSSHASSTSKNNYHAQVYPANPNIQLRIVKNHHPESQKPAQQSSTIYNAPPIIVEGPGVQNNPNINRQKYIPYNIDQNPQKNFINSTNSQSKIRYEQPINFPKRQIRFNSPPPTHSPSLLNNYIYQTPTIHQGSPQNFAQYMTPGHYPQFITPFSHKNAPSNSIHNISNQRQQYPQTITSRQFLSPNRVIQVQSPQKFFQHKNPHFRGGSPQHVQFHRRIQNGFKL